MEETLSRIRSHKGVEGVLIMTKEGSIIQSSLATEESTKSHASLLSQLTSKASSIVQTLDMNDELTFLRIRSQKKEILISPDKDFFMVVIQNPNTASSSNE